MVAVALPIEVIVPVRVTVEVVTRVEVGVLREGGTTDAASNVAIIPDPDSAFAIVPVAL
jgi:hypothetical protein